MYLRYTADKTTIREVLFACSIEIRLYVQKFMERKWNMEKQNIIDKIRTIISCDSVHGIRWVTYRHVSENRCKSNSDC